MVCSMPLTFTISQSLLSSSIFQSLLKLKYIVMMMPSSHFILWCPPSSTCNLSQHQGLFSESALCIRWPKYWSFSFSINPSNEYSGLITFRMEWFDPAVQRTLKHLVQHHSSKESILRGSVFCMVQLSHLYILLKTPYLWINGPLLAKWFLCFLIYCLSFI